MIRNSLKIFLNDKKTNHPLFTMRPEQMAVQDFIELTNILESPKLQLFYFRSYKLLSLQCFN